MTRRLLVLLVWLGLLLADCDRPAGDPPASDATATGHGSATPARAKALPGPAPAIALAALAARLPSSP